MKASVGRGARGRAVWAVVIAVACVVGGGCVRERVLPFDPRQIGEAGRAGARNQATAELRELPTDFPVLGPRIRRAPTAAELTVRPTPGSPLSLVGPRREFTLEQAIATAVANNPEIRAASFGPGIEASRVLEAQARFDPTFFANVSAEVSDRQTAGTLFAEPREQGFAPTRLLTEQRQAQFTGVTGIRQILEGGGQVEARAQLRRTDADPAATLIDPFREADLVLQLTQPLMRDFGGGINRARIEIARNNRRVGVLEFRAAVEETVFNVEETYWQLYAAQQQVRIAERLVEGAERTAEVIAIRLGTDASIMQYAQAQADAETRRAALIRAQSALRGFSDALMRLMNDPEFSGATDGIVVAVASPLDRPVRFDLLEMLETATLHRVELAQQRLRVDNATVTLDAAGNNLLPQLNFVGQVGASGLDQDAGGAFSNATDFEHISYSAGLQFEMPIGNREARAIYGRTRLQREQAMEQYVSAVSQVGLDVRNQHRFVESRWQELINARSARAYHEKALRAILAQQEAGEPLTPFFVRNMLDTQLRLAEAESQEIAALTDYNVAVARLARAKGTLLQYNNITLDERGLPGAPRAAGAPRARR